MGYRSSSYVSGHIRNGHLVSPHYRSGTVLFSPSSLVNIDIDNGRTELIRAAIEGRHDLVKQFITEGANPNQIDKFNQSALYYATINGHSDICATLKEHGADLAQEIAAVRLLEIDRARREASPPPEDRLIDPDGRTVLMRASMKGDVALLKRLLDKGDDPNQLDKFNQSALYYAAINERLDAVTILEAHGADRTQRERAERLLQTVRNKTTKNE